MVALGLTRLVSVMMLRKLCIRPCRMMRQVPICKALLVAGIAIRCFGVILIWTALRGWACCRPCRLVVILLNEFRTATGGWDVCIEAV